MKIRTDWKKSAARAAARVAASGLEHAVKKGFENLVGSSTNTKVPRDGPQVINTTENFVQLYAKKGKKRKHRKPSKFVKKVRKALEKSTPMNIIYQYSSATVWPLTWPSSETANQVVKGQDLGYTLGGTTSGCWPHTAILQQLNNTGWVKNATATGSATPTLNQDYILKLSKIDLTIKLRTIATLTTATCVILDIYECIATQSHSLGIHNSPYNTWDNLDSLTEPSLFSAGSFSDKGMTPWQTPGFGKFWSIVKKTRLRLTALEPHQYQLVGIPGFYGGKDTNPNVVIKGKTKGLLFIICGEPYLTGITSGIASIDVQLNRTVHWKLPNGASDIIQIAETMGTAAVYALGAT